MESDYKVTIPENVLAKNVQYFKRIEADKPTGSMFVSWNWPAFFLGHVWLIYRRCYFGAFIGYLIHVAILFCTNMISYSVDSEVIGFLLSLLPAVFFGLFGNALYYMFMRNKLRNLTTNSGNNEQYVVNKCRPSGVPVAVYFGVIFAIFMIICVFSLMVGIFAALVAEGGLA